ncbi:MAG: serine--tRNA ligase, partial [Arcobacteraceae bacterium]
MIDIKLLQKDFDLVSGALEKKGVTKEVLSSLKDQVEAAKEKRKEMESSQAEQKQLSQQFGSYKKEGKDVTPLQDEISKLKEKKQQLEDEVRDIETQMQNIAMGIPNLPDENVPLGADENENVVLETIGEKPSFTFEPKEHWELGENNGMID